jgi:hypothetical protein
VLRALTSFLGRFPARDTAQLTLGLDGVAAPAPPRDADALLARLRELGLRRIRHCRLTGNRSVMVSYRGDQLRVHRGYLEAPPEILQAIVVFVEGRTRADRRAAQRRLVGFGVASVERDAPVRRERPRPEDAAVAARLVEWHARYNAEHFGGSLRAIPVRVSRRMRSRLGHYSASAGGTPGEIAISWRHLRRHGWDEALHTLLHEMVHQWQDETGLPLDHGSAFRAKARSVGIAPSATRAPQQR